MGKNRLVAVTVFFAVVPMNVRRERHVSYFVQNSEKVRDRGKTQRTFSKLSRRDHLGFENNRLSVVKKKPFARLNLAAGANESGPIASCKLLRKKDFYLP